MLDTRFNCGINFQIKGKLLEKKSFKFLTLIMFLITDSDFQRDGSEGFVLGTYQIRHTESQNR